MMLILTVTLLVIVAFTSAFKGIQTSSLINSRRYAKIEVGSSSEIPNGERKLIETSSGTVVVANVNGGFYAVNAKCPHLGLPMKKGNIAEENGLPIITCNFHNSKFSMKDGACVTWCKGVLGLPGTGFLAGAMGKVGGKEGSPATAYPVVEENGKLFVEI